MRKTLLSVRGSCESPDICAGDSNTISNNALADGGNALRENGRVARAAVRSLITRSLPKTQQICAVTENIAVRAEHKLRTREYRNRQCFSIYSLQQPFTDNMSYTQRSNNPKTAIVIGLVCGALAIGIGLVGFIRRANRSPSRDPESAIARSQQRRENDGRWGATPAPVETAAERRRRNLQVRANRTAETGVETAARRERETREVNPPPPTYQRPAPAYYTDPEWRRQHLTGRRDLALASLPQAGDAPPAYDSTAVWPRRA